ncbi:MAG: Gfo/Idh/MocA family oxidoreductase [Bryobacteraceae bacterium]
MDRRQFTLAASAATVATAAGTPLHAALFTHAGGPHLSAYIPALAETPEIGRVSLCDPSGECVSAARKALGSRLDGVYTNPAELLRKEKPAMALVTMEAQLAPTVIAQALDAGAHVLAEKPACVALEDFAALAAKAKTEKRQLVLALANRVDPVVTRARQLVQQGAIGKVYGQQLHIVADQTRLTRPAYHQSWLASVERAGGGHLIWLGIHWLDLACYITGTRIRAVSAFTANAGGQPIDAEDSACVALEFDNGTLGTLNSGYYLDKGYHTMIKIWGSEGWIEMRRHTGPLLEWYSNASGKRERLETVDGPSGYTPFVQRMTRAFAGLAPPPLTAEDSLRALDVVFSAYRSARTGTRVRVES